MRTRCNNPNAKHFIYYGGKGVKICAEWDLFSSFRDWANANGYDATLTLDRKNASGNYCPDNCRWVSMAIQRLAQDRNRMIEAWGESKTMFEWAKDQRCRVNYKTMVSRLANGVPPETAIAKPVKLLCDSVYDTLSNKPNSQQC